MSELADWPSVVDHICHVISLECHVVMSCHYVLDAETRVVMALSSGWYKLLLLGVTQIILMSARSVTHSPWSYQHQPANQRRAPAGPDQWEARDGPRDWATAEMNLILTDINMICVTDMSHKYFTLYEPHMKTFYIWSCFQIEPQPTSTRIMANQKATCLQTKICGSL